MNSISDDDGKFCCCDVGVAVKCFFIRCHNSPSVTPLMRQQCRNAITLYDRRSRQLEGWIRDQVIERGSHYTTSRAQTGMNQLSSITQAKTFHGVGKEAPLNRFSINNYRSRILRTKLAALNQLMSVASIKVGKHIVSVTCLLWVPQTLLSPFH